MVHACHAGPALQPPEAVKRARVRASVPGLCARLQAPQASPLNFYGFRVTNPSTHPTTTFLCVCALCLCFASPCFHAQTSLLVLALRAAHTPQANRAALPLLRATTPRCVPPRRAVCHRTRLCAPKPRCFPPCPTVCCHHSCGAQLCCVSVTAPVHSNMWCAALLCVCHGPCAFKRVVCSSAVCLSRPLCIQTCGVQLCCVSVTAPVHSNAWCAALLCVCHGPCAFKCVVCSSAVCLSRPLCIQTCGVQLCCVSVTAPVHSNMWCAAVLCVCHGPCAFKYVVCSCAVCLSRPLCIQTCGVQLCCVSVTVPVHSNVWCAALLCVCHGPCASQAPPKRGHAWALHGTKFEAFSGSPLLCCCGSCCRTDALVGGVLGAAQRLARKNAMDPCPVHMQGTDVR